MKIKNLFIILIILLIAGAVYFQADIRKGIAINFFKQGSNYFGGVGYDLDKAEKWYKAALKVYPKLSNAHYQLARIYFVKNNFSAALNEINAELFLNPENQRSNYVRGLINGYSGNYQAAVDDFKKFIAWQPNEWAGYADLAWVYYEKSDYKKSEEVLSAALEKFPENAWLLNGLSAVYSKTNSPLFEEIFKKAQDTAGKLTINDFKRAYPGNDPKLLSGNFNNFKNSVGLDFAPACSSAIYSVCETNQCVGVICDPDHESCANTCGNNIDCGALPTVNLSGPDTVEILDDLWLSWTALDAESCAASGEWSGSKSITGGNETIWSPTTFALRGNHNFGLTCSNRNGSASDTQSVRVVQVPRCSFTANPSTIILPQTSTLNWNCGYVDSCSINQGVGNVSVDPETGTAVGSKEVRPSQSTTYTLTCNGLDGLRAFISTVNVGFTPRLREVAP